MSLVVTRAIGMVSIQDLGRPGRMHEALSPGGALVPALLISANRAAGNPDGAAAIEIMGSLEVRAEADVELAGDARWTLRAGELHRVDSEPRRVAYLAVRGGVDAPLVLGGRGTQRSAGIGALLAAGDRIVAAGLAEQAGAPPPPLPSGPIRLIPGPDRDAFEAHALATLLGGGYQIAATSDRVGTRLVGPPIPRRAGYRETSRPMVAGAIEVPTDGAPIVLGPEHPTTGGYPIVAVVAHADLGRLFAIRLGGHVRFTQRSAGPEAEE